jgi:hypothetical protein
MMHLESSLQEDNDDCGESDEARFGLQLIEINGQMPLMEIGISGAAEKIMIIVD